MYMQKKAGVKKAGKPSINFKKSMDGLPAKRTF